jgi:hypothetical protein
MSSTFLQSFASNKQACMSKGTSRPPSVDSKPFMKKHTSNASAGLTFLVYPETSPTPSPTITRQPFTTLMVMMVLEQSLECIILTHTMMPFSATSLMGMLPTLPGRNLLDLLPTPPPRNLLDLAPLGIPLALVQLTAHLMVSTTVLTPVAPILALNLPRVPRAPSAVKDGFTL